MKNNRPKNRPTERLRTSVRRRARRPERSQLVADLAGYRSEAELLELSAILSRHDDVVSGPLRDAVNWTPFA
jgi:hypothetical protein